MGATRNNRNCCRPDAASFLACSEYGPSTDSVAATAKQVRIAVAAVAPGIPNRTAAQKRNTTGAYNRESANPR